VSPCLIGKGVTLCRPPASQSLTHWSETIFLGPRARSPRKVFHHRTNPRSQVRCHRCRRRRYARNLCIIAQAWYDPMIVCAGGCRRPRARVARRAKR
ncbi:MAG: hypothetical protein AAB875_03940, partial [Patescibacteria group bacterium]